MKSKAVIIVPVHSETPSPDELFAFRQCYQVLYKYDIIVVHPAGLNLSEYRNVVPTLSNLPIDPVWQSSLSNYNKLKRSYFFYNLFSSYEYLLTYELDAFVFKDELEEWCDKGYSYIGAPWFKGYSKPVEPYEFIAGGNSGFSLRNVQTCLKVLERLNSLIKLNNIYKSLQLNKFCSLPTFLKITSLRKAFGITDTYYVGHFLTSHFINEDKFWSVWVPSIYPDFKIAPHHLALQFSFEVNPDLLYRMNGDNLPFGCHAWLKYNKRFWLNHIPYLSVIRNNSEAG